MFTSRRFRLSALGVAGTVLAIATTAPGASAANVRYAGPAGTGSDCSAAEPCSIVDAVGGAVAGDEVIVTPGDYALTSTLEPEHITMHGVAGQPRPRLRFSGPGQQGVRLWYATLRWVEVEQAPGTGIGALWTGNSTIDQVIARTDDTVVTAAIQNSAIRNSMIVASGDDGIALQTSTSGATNSSTYRNVTAVASGANGIAIHVRAGFAAGRASITATNVIARGGAGGHDVKARTDSTGAQATLSVDHSSYGSQTTVGTDAEIAPGEGNQSAPPVFVDAAGGDFHAAAGSPTIDAGADDPANGPLDVDGDPRSLGLTDIGANELVSAATPTSGGGAGTPPATSGTPTPPAAFAGVRLVSTRLTTAGRFVTLRLSCPAATAGRCTGVTRLSTRRPRRSPHAAVRVTVGRAGFSIAAGQRARVRVRLSRTGRRLLARTPRISGRASSAAHGDTGESKTTVAAVTIRRRAR
jgi:hypothetical protein